MVQQCSRKSYEEEEAKKKKTFNRNYLPSHFLEDEKSMYFCFNLQFAC